MLGLVAVTAPACSAPFLPQLPLPATAADATSALVAELSCGLQPSWTAADTSGRGSAPHAFAGARAQVSCCVLQPLPLLPAEGWGWKAKLVSRSGGVFLAMASMARAHRVAGLAPVRGHLLPTHRLPHQATAALCSVLLPTFCCARLLPAVRGRWQWRYAPAEWACCRAASRQYRCSPAVRPGSVC